MNKQNLVRVMNHIIEHPETWDQKDWHCGTSHCFAGWAQVMSGKLANTNTTRKDAEEWLEISKKDADWLFASCRKMPDLYDFVSSAVKDEIPYINGYDLNGYDPEGYDRKGYNHDGYNRDGYNEKGLDKDGNPLPLIQL